MDYKGYSMHYDNHKLYVKIKGSVLTLGKREGAFQFTVDTNPYGFIQEIEVPPEAYLAFYGILLLAGDRRYSIH